MSLLSYFRSQRRKSTAAVARDRLQVLVAHERARREGHDYLPALREELLAVIRKYVEVDQSAIQMEIDHDGDCEILELNITLPER